MLKDYVTSSSSRTTQCLAHFHNRSSNDDHNSFPISKPDFHRRFDSLSRPPFAVRWIAHSVRTVTTAAAPAKPSPDDDQNNGKRKQASPEDCDEAVQGLSSTAKAAKAKKLQDSQKISKMLKKVWATFLGIGPALRAVASMSRFAFF